MVEGCVVWAVCLADTPLFPSLPSIQLQLSEAEKSQLPTGPVTSESLARFLASLPNRTVDISYDLEPGPFPAPAPSFRGLFFCLLTTDA